MEKSEMLLEKAEKLLKTSETEKSIEKSLKSLSLQKSFKAYCLLGFSFMRNKNYQNSIKYANEGLSYLSTLPTYDSHNDQKFRLYMIISTSQKNQKDYSNSKKTLEECLTLDHKTQIVNKHLKELEGLLSQPSEYKEYKSANSTDLKTPNEKFFIINANWLKSWKSFQLSNQSPHPGDLSNKDLLFPITEKHFTLDQFEETKFIINPELKEKKDFKILTQKAYEIVTNGVKVDHEICRFSQDQPESGQFQVEVFFPQRVVKILGLEYKIPQKYFFSSKLTLVSDLKSALVELVTPKLSMEFSEAYSQIWKIPETYNLPSLISPSTRLYIPSCDLLDESLTLEENKVAPSDILLLEFQRFNDSWTIIKGKLQKCQNCSSTENLSSCSKCKKAKYCSPACQRSHFYIHKQKCVPQQVTYSKQGRVGLQNLGNTCFMNSGLQCLSSCKVLTEYFVSKSYTEDLNTDNPLGTKGAQLAIKYAELVKEMWHGNSSVVSPWDFKMCLSRFASQFSGYHQHDSQEFLSFLLSGLHEDLNRIKKKVYVETPEQKEMSEEVYAGVMWEWFLKRNQSIIVDHMYGQHKSTVVCPQCETVSVTFDPFLMLSAVLPSLGSINVMVFLDGKKAVQMKVEVEKYEKVGTLRKKLEDSYNCKFVGIIMDKLKFYSFLKDEDLIGSLKSSTLLFNEAPKNIEEYEVIPLNISKAGDKGKYSTQKTPGSMPRMIFVKKNSDSLALFDQVKTLLSLVYSDNKRKLPETIEEHLENPLFLINICKPKALCELCQKKCEGCPLTLTPSLKISDLSKLFSNLNYPSIILEAEIEIKASLASLNQWQSGSTINLIKNTKIDVQCCLELANYPETLDEENKWYCSNCKDHVRATKQFKVYKFPKVLIIHLLRFKKKQIWTEKITDFVDFPVENLTLDSICEKNVKFNLFAISNHYGGTGGGHYTAFVKNQEAWYEMDDSRVSQVSPTSIVTNGAYLLFYERINY